MSIIPYNKLLNKSSNNIDKLKTLYKNIELNSYLKNNIKLINRIEPIPRNYFQFWFSVKNTSYFHGPIINRKPIRITFVSI
jgi:hypothetical protein